MLEGRLFYPGAGACFKLADYCRDGGLWVGSDNVVAVGGGGSGMEEGSKLLDELCCVVCGRAEALVAV